MSGANFTPENIRDDDNSRVHRSKTRNNFNYVALALSAIQKYFADALQEVNDKIIKPALRGGFNINDIRYFGTAENVVAKIPSTSSQTVYVTSVVSVLNDLTVPSNISLVVIKGGGFNIASGKTLTINGSFDGQGNAIADLFTGSGSYVFGKAVRLVGAGTPEAAVAAPIGSEYLRNNGSTGTTLYIKESGTGNTGWVVPGSGAVTGSGTSGRVAYWNGASSLTSTADFLFTDGGSGSTSLLTLLNGNNAANSHAGILLQSTGGSGGDPYIEFNPNDGNGVRIFIGSDNSDSNKFKFETGSGLGSGGNNFITFDVANNRLGLQTDTPTYEVDFARSFSAGQTMAVRNTGTSSGGFARLFIQAGTNASDPYILFFAGSGSIVTGTYYAMGPDNSVSGDPFRLESGATGLGSGTLLLEVTAAGIFTLSNATDASAVGTASMALLGGLGVAKKMYLGDDLNNAGNVKINTAGKGLQVKSGANSRMDMANILVAGVVVVANTSVTANTIFLPSVTTAAGTQGALSFVRNAGVGYTINSSNLLDTSTVDVLLVEAT